jgi:drug/metabolite transporter (DMT)-like permease
MWGSSFLFIAVGLEAFRPAAVTLLRLVFGVLTLAVFPASRRPVPRSEWGAIALLGLLWMAAPELLFSLAQQWIGSSLAGMINGAVPLFVAVISAVMVRRLPARWQSAGLLVGFAGVVMISWPSVQGGRATALGIALVLLATTFYGIAINLAVPLQRRHGTLAVLWRAQLFALALVLVPGFAALPHSSFAWRSLLAVLALGCLGTALAFVAMTTLAGRVGAARGSVAIYFLPVVAIGLGVILRGEHVALIGLAGSGLVAIGAFFASRRERADADKRRS